MAFLSLVTGVVDSTGERVDLPQTDGTYLPVRLKLGLNLSGTPATNGGQTDITIAQYGDSARFGAVYSYLDTAPSTRVVRYEIQMKKDGGLYLALYTRSLWALHTKR